MTPVVIRKNRAVILQCARSRRIADESYDNPHLLARTQIILAVCDLEQRNQLEPVLTDKRIVQHQVLIIANRSNRLREHDRLGGIQNAHARCCVLRKLERVHR